MKRRLAAFFCALLLVLSLAPAPAKAAWNDDLILLAVNVKLLPLAEYMPIRVNGSVYVPVSIFDASTNGGVNLGVFSSLNKSLNTYTLYSGKANLVFDLSSGLSYNYLPQDGGVQKDPRALIRNGKVYVTLSPVCRYFGLENTYHANADHGYPMVRVKSPDCPLYDDAAFLDSARVNAINGVLNDYQAYVTAQEGGAPPAPGDRPTPTQPTEGNRDALSFRLAFRFDTGESGSAILDALAAEGRSAAIFFPVNQLAAQDDLVRRAMGEGHSVGLLIPGVMEEARTAIEEGGRLLAHVGRTRTRLLLLDGADGAVQADLEAQGFRCWTGGIDGVPAGRSGYATAGDVLRAAAGRKTLAQVTMDDSAASASALPTVLRTVRQEKYSYRPVAETEIS